MNIELKIRRKKDFLDMLILILKTTIHIFFVHIQKTKSSLSFHLYNQKLVKFSHLKSGFHFH